MTRKRHTIRAAACVPCLKIYPILKPLGACACLSELRAAVAAATTAWGHLSREGYWVVPQARRIVPMPFFWVVRLSQDPGFTGMERKQPTPNSHANARSQTRREIRLEPAQTSHRLEWHVREPLRRSSRPAEKRKSLPDQKRKKRYQPPPRLPDTGALPANQFHLANDR